MNSKLWRAIRLERTRRNAVSQAIKRDVDPWNVSGKTRFRSHWTFTRRFGGVLKRSLEVRAGLRAAEGSRLVLPEEGGRYQEILRSLYTSGLSKKEVSVILDSRRKMTWNLGWIVLLLELCWIFLNTTKSSKKFFDIIAIYHVAKRETKHWKKAYFLCIGDTSPFLIALCAGAGAAGQPVVAWQVDYMDWKPFPIIPAMAVSMNWTGLRLAFGPGANCATNEGKVFWQPPTQIVRVKFRKTNKRVVGILLAWPYESFVYETLVEVKESVDAEIVIRPHPRTPSDDALFPDGMRVSDSNMALEEFVQGVEWVICGNTSAALKVLSLGKAVLQIGGLDRARFDKHKYVSNEIIHGVKEIGTFTYDEMIRFYQRGDYLKNLTKLVAPSPEKRKRGLEEFVRAIT